MHTSEQERAKRAPLAQFAGVLGIWMVGSGTATAGLFPLGSVPGQTELQSNTGDSVQAVCKNLSENRESLVPPGSLTADLLDRCGEMVQTVNGGNRSLEISDAELNAALQNLATEESAAAGTMTTRTSAGQATNVLARLTALRAGVGSSMAGLRLLSNDQVYASRDLPPELQGGLSGGGASADSIAATGKWGFFLNGALGTGDKDQTDREVGLDFDNWNITAGADYRLSDRTVIGGAVGYNNFDSDFQTSSVVAGGHAKADGYSVSVYGTHYVDNWYIEGMAGYGSLDYDLERRIVYPSNNPAVSSQNRTATGSPDSDYYTISIGGGYELQQAGFSITPFVRLDYLDQTVKAYTEQGAAELALKVEDQDVTSTRSVLGVSASKPFSTGSGVWIPFARFDWNHEFDDDERVIKSTYVYDPAGFPLIARSDGADRDFFRLGLGVSGVFKGGTQGFLQYETVLGLRDITEHQVTAGVRFEY